MVDFTSSNLQAANEKYNNIVSKLNDVKNDALANLQTEASSAAAALSSQLSNVTTELRSLVPEPISIPNINLQAQLQSLSGLTDPTQSANLLTSINTNFSTALTSSGFNLDTLVSSASAAVAAGTSLSGTIPNFELPASGIGDAIQKASNVKIPSIDPIIETAAGFSDNTEFTNAVTTAQNAVLTTYETLPIADIGTLKVSDKFKKITQSIGGISITKEVTTVTQALEEIDGVIVRKNISSKGFSNRVVTISEKFAITDMEEIEGDKVVTLKHEPIKIIKVSGKTITTENIGGVSTNRFQLLNVFNVSQLIGNVLKSKYNKDLYSLYLFNNKQVVIKQDWRTYNGTPWAIRVTYKYNETYDPSVATA